MAEKWLHAVAKSGNYNDLENKPESLPANGGNADTLDGKTINDDTATINNLWTSNKINNELNKKANTIHNHVNVSQASSGFMSNTDKTKLDGIENSANKYVHPNNHPASMITQDSTHKFVTDAQIKNFLSETEKKYLLDPIKVADNTGYMKLQGGIIFQWGEFTATDPAKWNIFPIAFPEKCFVVNATGTYGGKDMSINGKTKDGFEALHAGTANGYYIAIGW